MLCLADNPVRGISRIARYRQHNEDVVSLAIRWSRCDARADGIAHRTEATLGDKSPKSKERDKKQKAAATSRGDAAAKSRQDANSRAPKVEPLTGRKGKK